MRANRKIDTFALEPGDALGAKYVVNGTLGGGWESEVYLVRERATSIIRAAKIFFPQRNPSDRAARAYARKLHRLATSGSVVQYVGHEQVRLQEQHVTMLVSEYLPGASLDAFLRAQPQKRLHYFAALHLLRALAEAVAEVHYCGEYHGDLHVENVLVERIGLGFSVKLLDPARAGRRSARHIQDDVVDLVRLFVEAVGGPSHYRKLPRDIVGILGSPRRDRVLRKFRTVAQLRDHLDHLAWD